MTSPCAMADRQAIEAGGGHSAGGCVCHVSGRPQVAFAHHHRGADGRDRAGAGSRLGQVRREAVRGQLHGLPSQPSRARQGQVQLDAVALPAPALHEQPRLGAGAHRLSAVGRCPSRQAAVCRPQVAVACDGRIGALATSAGAGAGPLGIIGSCPDGATWLASAELIARKLRGINDATAAVPGITQHLRLPAFRYSGRDPYSWPRT